MNQKDTKSNKSPKKTNSIKIRILSGHSGSRGTAVIVTPKEPGDSSKANHSKSASTASISPPKVNPEPSMNSPTPRKTRLLRKFSNVTRERENVQVVSSKINFSKSAALPPKSAHASSRSATELFLKEADLPGPHTIPFDS